jgi:hypothetical protein
MALQPYGHAYEKLLGAVEQLATGDLPLNERLGRATAIALPLRRKHLPADAWQRFQLLLGSLTDPYSDGDERAIAARLRKMPDAEARRCTREFVALYNMVSTLHHSDGRN